MDYPDLERDFDSIPAHILPAMSGRLMEGLEKCGLYYRLFSRTKSAASTRSKLRIKNYPPGKRMQDLFGIRIAAYFEDDQAICRRIIEDRFSVVGVTEDRPDPNTFSPTRLNFICKLPMACRQDMPRVILERYPIDSTVEIQLRTVFSEGWHEVEHDLRYKAKDDWNGSADLSRALNGIFATLITCDWSMLNIFDELSKRKYREKDWTAYLKNKFRIHVEEQPLDPSLGRLFSERPELAAELYQIDRSSVLRFLSDARFPGMELTLDNLVFLMNTLFLHNETISAATPETLRRDILACARKR